MSFASQRLRAGKGELEDTFSDTSLSEHEASRDSDVTSGTEKDSTKGDGSESDDGSDASSSPPSPRAALEDISFGALASAQESLGDTRKRKRSQKSQSGDRKSPSPSRTTTRTASDGRGEKKKSMQRHHSRSSKHAPAEMSSTRPVTRKRIIFEAQRAAARDPRFSSLSGRLSEQRLEHNYKFLEGYREDEVNRLKERVKKEKDAGVKEALKKELRSKEDRARAKKRAEEERDVVREHKRQERSKVKDGKKPFFLKKGDIKKQLLVKQFESMGEGRAEKAMERRRKKKASRERRNMPAERRITGA